MNATTATPLLFVEVDHREADGIEVSLVLNRADHTLAVVVTDDRTGVLFELAVSPDTASDVFRHPYAYA